MSHRLFEDAETNRRFSRMQWRMLFAGWATDRLFGGRAPRLCVVLMALTAALLAVFWFLPAGLAGAALFACLWRTRAHAYGEERCS